MHNLQTYVLIIVEQSVIYQNQLNHIVQFLYVCDILICNNKECLWIDCLGKEYLGSYDIHMSYLLSLPFSNYLYLKFPGKTLINQSI